MKWYLHKHHKQHLEDLKVERDTDFGRYLPWVSQIANTFARDSVACGILNFEDLVQAGYIGLVEAYNVTDHDRPQAEKWSFIKKRIKYAIRREIDNYGAFIKIPRRQLENDRKQLTGVDKILVNTFASFFDKSMIIEMVDYSESYENEQLSLTFDDYLYSSFKNIDHVEILRASYGIDRDKPMSIKELANKYRKSEIGIKKIKSRLLDKIKQDEKFKIIINNFYQN